MNVIFLPEVVDYLEYLVPILYEKGYFGMRETAKKYIDSLVDDIEANLPTKLHRPALPYFDRYGKDLKYAVFKKNRRTSWYAFFETYEENESVFYLVRYIANNHTVAQYL